MKSKDGLVQRGKDLFSLELGKFAQRGRQSKENEANREQDALRGRELVGGRVEKLDGANDFKEATAAWVSP